MRFRRKQPVPALAHKAPFPHCDSGVLHAPGECRYCDGYPERQAMRRHVGTPFTPNEANGWSGNVAVPATQGHWHMGAYIPPVEDGRGHA